MGIQATKAECIKNICRAYDIDLIDKGYGKNSLIISIGSGLMMATMDLLDDHRFAIEFKKEISLDAFSLLNLYVENVSVTAWFSISKPVYLHKSLSSFSNSKIFYYANCELIGKRVYTLKELKDEISKNISGTEG